MDRHQFELRKAVIDDFPLLSEADRVMNACVLTAGLDGIEEIPEFDISVRFPANQSRLEELLSGVGGIGLTCTNGRLMPGGRWRVTAVEKGQKDNLSPSTEPLIANLV